MIRPQAEQTVPGGGGGAGDVVDDSEEEAAVPVVRAVGRFGRECEPYILPLFPLESEQMMGREVSVRPTVRPSFQSIISGSICNSSDIPIRSASNICSI